MREMDGLNMVASEPRIAPASRRERALLWVFAWVAGRAIGMHPPNLFTTMGRHRRLLRGWLAFARRLMPGGRLPRRETELVILRVAHLRDCRYEREHHLRIGWRAGLGDDDFQRVAAGPAEPGWSEREAAILQTVDELNADRDVSDATWSALSVHLGERELIELIMLIAHYEMLATFIGALRIQPDRPLR